MREGRKKKWKADEKRSQGSKGVIEKGE